MKRLFLVGCPRSGTTLLQSLMASHSKIVSFPETHLFSKTMSIHPLLRMLKIYGDKDLKKVQGITEELGCSAPLPAGIKTPVFFTSTWTASLLSILDHIATSFDPDRKASFLLEKTPRHLHFIPQIQAADPEAHFIHIIRKGEDVVASLHEATSDSPDQWDGSRSLKKSVFWWNRSIRISENYIGKPGHSFVWYDELVQHTEEVINRLFSEIGIDMEPGLTEQHNVTAQKLIKEEESWKAKNTQSSINSSNKFELLSDEEQAFVRAKLIPFDFDQIAVIKADRKD